MEEKINDGHLHISSGLKEYDLKPTYRNIIYNFIEEYREKSDIYRNDKTHQTLIFDFRNQQHIDFLLTEIKHKRVQAIKIHSRIQKIEQEEYQLLFDKITEIPKNIPIIFDAFYDGPDIEYQPSLEQLIRLSRLLPNHKIVVAHSGGYELLKYFFHLRTVPNIYFGLSLTLHYLVDSHVKVDVIKLLRFVDKKRILFGTDFPFAPASGQLKNIKGLIQEAGLTTEEESQILYENYLNVFDQ